LTIRNPPEALEDTKAIQLRHHHVEHHNIRVDQAEHIDGLEPVGHRRDRKSFHRQTRLQHTAGAEVVVSDQNGPKRCSSACHGWICSKPSAGLSTAWNLIGQEINKNVPIRCCYAFGAARTRLVAL
jgi:hypothetical protein